MWKSRAVVAAARVSNMFTLFLDVNTSLSAAWLEHVNYKQWTQEITADAFMQNYTKY